MHGAYNNYQDFGSAYSYSTSCPRCFHLGANDSQAYLSVVSKSLGLTSPETHMRSYQYHSTITVY